MSHTRKHHPGLSGAYLPKYIHLRRVSAHEHHVRAQDHHMRRNTIVCVVSVVCVALRAKVLECKGLRIKGALVIPMVTCA